MGFAYRPGIETLYWLLFEVPDFLSYRKQLLGIKRRAEQAASATSSTVGAEPL
jgi:hypothetical protein